MVSSIILAKIFGPYCMIVALGVLINLKNYEQMLEALIKNSAMVYLAGVIALIFGLIIIVVHNVWVLHWPVIITIMGWLGFIKGIWLIVFPNSLPKVLTYHQKNSSHLVARLILIFILGVVLTTFGYFNF